MHSRPFPASHGDFVSDTWPILTQGGNYVLGDRHPNELAWWERLPRTVVEMEPFFCVVQKAQLHDKSRPFSVIYCDEDKDYPLTLRIVGRLDDFVINPLGTALKRDRYACLIPARVMCAEHTHSMNGEAVKPEAAYQFIKLTDGENGTSDSWADVVKAINNISRHIFRSLDSTPPPDRELDEHLWLTRRVFTKACASSCVSRPLLTRNRYAQLTST